MSKTGGLFTSATRPEAGFKSKIASQFNSACRRTGRRQSERRALRFGKGSFVSATRPDTC